MSRWNEYWFVDDAPLNLAIARVVAASIALWLLCSRDFSAISGLPAVYWEGVPSAVRWRYLIFPDNVVLEAILMWLARAAAAAALIGLAPRFASFATALLLYHLAPLESIIWTTSPYGRGLTLPLLALLICAAAPSGDALAIGSIPRTGRSWSYGWPLRLLQFFVSQVYFFSGVGKLRESGLAWTSANNLRHWLLVFTQNDQVAVHTTLGQWLASSDAIVGILGVGILLFELGFVLALIRWRGRVVIALLAIVFHAAIFWAMNITFHGWPLLLVFIDWDRMLQGYRGRAGVAKPSVVTA